MVGIPGMVGPAALVPSVRAFFPQQAVMLYVIGAGQLPPGKSNLNGQKRQDGRPEEKYQSAVQDH